ncbi:hypothetical protein T4D_12885 [Trichinella pseudospiralis]|uniref:Uncharacterized protein n=1 Tax=Trichinella pseudospiralis TaxID=6337 RepID=A0A0V1G4M7_TRIPS|nr:hypothetical protein T4D_12885 [Trichinella pseudospiralis]
MKAVLNCMLSQDPEVRRETSAYIDDILRGRRGLHEAASGALWADAQTDVTVTDGVRLLGLKEADVEAEQWRRRGARRADPPLCDFILRQAGWPLPGLLVATSDGDLHQKKG